MHVAHLTSAHLPFDVRIFHKECRTLSSAGHHVTLIVPHDKDERVDGVRLRAIAKPNGRKERMLQTIWRVYRAALREDADLYHFHDPELIPIGLLLKLRGKRVIYDVHEDLPRLVSSKNWIAPWLRQSVAIVCELTETLTARLVDGIVAVTPTIAARFPAKRTVLVANFPILDELVAEASCPYAERPPIAVYVGNISAARGAREMVQAMGRLPPSLGARLAIVGRYTSPNLKEELREAPGWQFVSDHGWQSRESVARILGTARVGLVLFHPEPNHVNAQPNKLFEYMSAGIPVIASDFPLWREIIDGANCGLLVDPASPQEIAEAIEWLLAHPQEAAVMGQHGQEAVKNKYNWAMESSKLLALYRTLES